MLQRYISHGYTSAGRDDKSVQLWSNYCITQEGFTLCASHRVELGHLWQRQLAQLINSDHTILVPQCEGDCEPLAFLGLCLLMPC